MATATLANPSFNSRSSSRNCQNVRSISSYGMNERDIEQEIEESFLRSEYMRRMEDLNSLVQQTASLCRIQSNWDSYGADPPKTQAIHAAMRFLPRAADADVLPTWSLPSAEGGVALRFVAADRRALVEFLNTGAIEVMLYNEAGVLNSELEESGDIEEILHAVQAHLMR